MLLALGDGSLEIIFMGLSVMFVEHWLRKFKLRNGKKRCQDKNAESEKETKNFDFQNSYLLLNYASLHSWKILRISRNMDGSS